MFFATRPTFFTYSKKFLPFYWLMFVISVLYAKISLTAKTQNQISFLPSFRCRSPARKTHITLRKKKQQTRSAKTAQALQLYMRCTCSSLSLASLLSLRVTGTHTYFSLPRARRTWHSSFFSSSLRLFFRGCIMCMRIMCVRIEWVCYRGVRARRMGSDVMGLSWNDRMCFSVFLIFHSASLVFFSYLV